MRQYSFTSKQRLKRESEFKSVFKDGQRFETDLFKAFYKMNNRQFSRLGVSVSKRAGNAPLRNKVKRVVREWFRLNCSEFSSPVDVIFTFRKNLPGFSKKNLRVQLENIDVLKQKV